MNVARSQDEAKIQSQRGTAVLTTEEAEPEVNTAAMFDNPPPMEVPYDASIEQPDVVF